MGRIRCSWHKKRPLAEEPIQCGTLGGPHDLAPYYITGASNLCSTKLLSLNQLFLTPTPYCKVRLEAINQEPANVLDLNSSLWLSIISAHNLKAKSEIMIAVPKGYYRYKFESGVVGPYSQLHNFNCSKLSVPPTCMLRTKQAQFDHETA